MTMREIQKYIEAERAKLQEAIGGSTETREQEVNRRLKHRDEEWLSKMESLLSIAISNLGGRVEVQAVGKFVNEMRQWAKEEE